MSFSAEQVQLLRRTFAGLDSASLAGLASITHERVLPPGAYLCHEGRVENTFYLISSGRVMVSQRLEEDTTRTLAYRGPGEFVGELSLFEAQPRTADVVTLDETTVLEIEQSGFLDLLQRSPSIVLAILRILADRQRESDQHTIADLRQKYTELDRAYQRLKEAIERRSEFLTVVAHELRTPLTVVKGYLSLLRSGALSGPALTQVVGTITTNLDTMMRLVNNILLLQEVGLVDPKFRTVSLGEVIESLVNGLRSSDRLPASLAVRTELAANLPSIQADPKGLQHALGAILDNAIKFTPGGGEIVIQAHTNGGTVDVAICDSGVGIASDILPHIFSFHHTDTAGSHMVGGIGLGLPLAQAVIEQHKGKIEVVSKPGQGSTFTVKLPIKQLATKS
ncbi:MAG: cyclic nucleotide-binding domain-containing protein [Thermoflexales bacterium]|nr:cyclic nucleotide-binding domain-containing protein [Thermoflexales bacterium]